MSIILKYFSKYLLSDFSRLLCTQIYISMMFWFFSTEIDYTTMQSYPSGRHWIWLDENRSSAEIWIKGNICDIPIWYQYSCIKNSPSVSLERKKKEQFWFKKISLFWILHVKPLLRKAMFWKCKYKYKWYTSVIQI